MHHLSIHDGAAYEGNAQRFSQFIKNQFITSAYMMLHPMRVKTKESANVSEFNLSHLANVSEINLSPQQT